MIVFQCVHWHCWVKWWTFIYKLLSWLGKFFKLLICTLTEVNFDTFIFKTMKLNIFSIIKIVFKILIFYTHLSQCFNSQTRYILMIFIAFYSTILFIITNTVIKFSLCFLYFFFVKKFESQIKIHRAFKNSIIFSKLINKFITSWIIDSNHKF